MSLPPNALSTANPGKTYPLWPPAAPSWNPFRPSGGHGAMRKASFTTPQQDLLIPEANGNLAIIEREVIQPFSNRSLIPKPDPDAQLLPPTPIWQEGKDQLVTAAQTVSSTLQGKPVSDYQLARTDRFLQQLGGFSIAGLGALTSASLFMGFKEFLGAATFFGLGMTLPKLAIDSVLRARTSLNFNQQYISSYHNGERKPLFGNPEYLPLQLLPEAQLSWAANHLGVEQHPSDSGQARENRKAIQKLLVQKSALLMLVAGPLTPLIASVTSHFVEPLLEKPLLRLKLGAKESRLLLDSQVQAPAEIARSAQRYVHSLVGHAGTPDSMLAQWWRELGPKIQKAVRLNRLTKSKTNQIDLSLRYGQGAELLEKNIVLAKHLIMLPKQHKRHLQKTIDKQADQLLQFARSFDKTFKVSESKVNLSLIRQLGKLADDGVIQRPSALIQLLKQGDYKEAIQPLSQWRKSVALPAGTISKTIDTHIQAVEKMGQLRKESTARLMDAMSTLANYSHALNTSRSLQASWDGADFATKSRLLHQVRDILEQPSFPVVKELFERNLQQPIEAIHGALHYEPASTLIRIMTRDKQDNFLEMLKELIMQPDNLNQDFKAAATITGMTPAKHLLQTYESISMRNAWRWRAIGGLAGLGGFTIFAAAKLIGQPEKEKKAVNSLKNLAEQRLLNKVMPGSKSQSINALIPQPEELGLENAQGEHLTGSDKTRMALAEKAISTTPRKALPQPLTTESNTILVPDMEGGL